MRHNRVLTMVLLAGLLLPAARSALAIPGHPPLHPAALADSHATPLPRYSLAAPTVTSHVPAPTANLHWLMYPAGTLLLVGEIAFVIFLVLRDSRRVLERTPSTAWLHGPYGRQLPNVLSILAQKRFPTPWPRRRACWAIYGYKRRAARALRPVLKNHTACFLDSHLGLWLWLQAHQDTLGQLLCRRQQRCARERLLSETSPAERRALLAFLNACADAASDPQEFGDAAAIAPRFVKQLDRCAMVFREHGYHLSPDFALLDELEHAGVRDLVEDLKPLTTLS
jgi:hypothetical protein